MKALRYYGPGEIRVEETPIPDLCSGEVKVQVRSAGICATDVKTFLRGHPKIQPGSVIGHEIAGVIIEVNRVDGWQLGDRVAVAPYAPCLECPQCKRKSYTTCDRLMEQGIDPGGFSEYVRVPDRIVAQDLIHLPDDISFSLGSLAEPLACCIHGLEVLHLQPEDTLIVIGDGTMGLLQSLLARKMGVQKIILTGMIPERLAKARAIADLVIDAGRQDLAVEIKKVAPAGADKMMVSVGDTRVVESSMQFVRKGGILNIYAGMPKGQMMSLDPNLIHYNEVSLVGTFGFAPHHFRQAVDLLGSMREELGHIISGTVKMDNIRNALMDMAEYRGIKYLVEFPA
ncbi:MAG: hypothetical protein A2X25_06395 [Chloroflexi bacterium GWB2_49_20]|nr:MAG: hypothetical protein A2X25_06395 [Chloroflexi bacterium GWB2_49_20]OGN80329.1 MAG: hypothetical protein A2X26_08385 [Chloroflexi bacterium GWC2_49_37]OGN86031.1 MAG: hypothetical protein A2X27_00360 [Chloroflexi bacterium GWD2_49_16]HCC79330.1 hypothetical protein [Anaerolineae bacterium]HCM96449.1 hypothetical protein [Anaerolineae bacterium]